MTDATGEAAPRHERDWSPGRPVDLRATVGTLVRGGGDPSHRFSPDGAFWRATRTPQGPGVVRIAVDASAARVSASAWGPGAAWLLDGVPELLGERDDAGADFRPRAEHPRLVAALRARPHWRVPRTRAVFEAMSNAVLEQVVTGGEAARAIRDLVRRYGESAPGPLPPGATRALMVPPEPLQWARIPSWEWLRAGVEQRRSATVIRAARVAGRLDQTIDRAPEQVEGLLRTLPGVGRWTAAEVRQRAHGDPDAFSFDDFHVARNVSWGLIGEVLDDDGCAELIECYAGHRYRVQRLLELAGVARPRRGPKMTLPTHTPSATRGRS